MNAYICDRCGNVILPVGNAGFVTFYSQGMFLDHTNRADLCGDCFRLVEKIAFGKAKTDLEG